LQCDIGENGLSAALSLLSDVLHDEGMVIEETSKQYSQTVKNWDIVLRVRNELDE
jgi:hypothetical protein